MASKELEDIMALARRESARVGHFYVGVEHLFIALTRLKGGVTVGTLEEHGIAPRFIRYLIRQEVGQGDGRRFWPGFRETPRLHTVLRLAQELAQTRGDDYPSERDLFLAILREGDSLPCRVLHNIDADLGALIETALNWSSQMRPQHPPVPLSVREGIALDSAEAYVLRQMFRGYARVEVERQLMGGYSSARVLVACPYRADGRADAAVVVKLDERQTILYEKMRYDSFVRATLPHTAARMLDNPVVPDNSRLGGLKYTFVRGSTAGPVDLVAYARERGFEALSDLLWNGVYKVFGETWWGQRHPYRFGVWQEYEMMLPPALIVEALPGQSVPRRRLTPAGHWSRRGRFAHHEVVLLENFTVQKVYPERSAIQLAGGAGPDAASRANKIEVRGVDLSSGQYYQGAMIGQIVGQVLFTRTNLLYQQVAELEPPFDITANRLPSYSGFPVHLPNPLMRYLNVLQRRVSGTLSIIHGDLHLHNILVGSRGNAWLIDFALTREGHTLFDWAVLETSLLIELVAPALSSDSWEELWPVLRLLLEMGISGQPPEGRLPVEIALHPVATVRQIVAECLAEPDDWREYFVALSLCALRGLGWPTVPLKAKRLLFMVSALAMASAAAKDGSSPSTSDIDTTDASLKWDDEE